MTAGSDKPPEADLATNTVAPPTGAQRELQPGAQLGRYTITGQLGQGGMGVVYAAIDSQLNRSVAIKLLRVERGDDTARARLLREAQAMARVSHPNVVTVYEAAAVGELAFVAMEQVEGLTLKAWLKQAPRTWREVVTVFLQAGRGLAAAHGAGIVHRDFKPDNVLIGANGRVYVSDFGVARALDAAALAAPAPSASASRPDMLHSPLTVEGQVMGTVAYMAPEQLADAAVDGRTDEFSFCVALYEALHGERPFTREGTALTRKPERPPTSAPGWLLKVVERGLALEPGQRYPTMEALLQALEKDPRWGRVAAAVAVVGLLGAAAFALWSSSRDSSLCASPAHGLDQVWNDEVRARVRAGFLASGVADAPVRWTYAAKAIDREAGLWLGAVESVCRARDAHQQAASAIALRLECLERQRQDLTVFMELVATPTKELAAAATSAVHSLDHPALCQDARILPVIDDLPPDKKLIARGIRADVVRALVLGESGKMPEAIALLQSRLEPAATLDAPSLHVLLRYALAAKFQRTGQHDQALRQLKEAVRMADAAQLPTQGALAAAGVVAELALGGGTRAEVDAAAEEMKRAAARARGSALVEDFVEFSFGVMQNARGQAEQAIPHFVASLKAAREIEGEDTLNALTTLNNLGASYDSLGRATEALATYRDAIALSERVTGPNPKNMRVRLLWLNVGFTDTDLHQYPEARDALERSLAGAENAYSAISHAIIAEIAAQEGKPDEARAQLEQATALLARLKVDDSAEALEVYRRAALAAALIGDRDLAAKAGLRVEALATRLLEPTSADWVPLLGATGAAAQLSSDPARAVARLERALALASHPFFPGCLAEIRYRLARALVETHGDKARAEALCAQAADELRPLPTRAATLAELTAWQQKTFGKTP